jgi:hypothetical protein
MKPARHESTKQTSPKRKRRARPTPRWLKSPPADGPEAVAQRRCLLILSVLSGEQPVTDAIEATGVSRQLYYQLEEKALKAMMRALLPSAEGREEVETSLAGQVQSLQTRVKQLETEKRRAERLLLLTRKLVRPGPVKTENRGRPRRSAGAGKSASRTRPTKPETPSVPPPDSSMTAGETTP